MFLQFLAFTVVAAVGTLVLAADPSPTTRPAPVILLKLDDIVADKNRPISPRWQRTLEFIEQEGIKANFGIIGYSLEEDAPAYFAWIRETAARGNIEFWNHGYRNRKSAQEPDEFAGTLQEQTDALQKTQRLAKEKLGLTLKAFGAHWSKTNEHTAAALATCPEIRFWFCEPGNRTQPGQTALITNRLEQPTFVPNPQNMQKVLERWKEPYLVLQGHPNGWDDQRFADFVTIIRDLKSRGCRFMTMSEYLAAVGG